MGVPIKTNNEVNNRRIIRHCDKWVTAIDGIQFAACASMVCAAIMYWITDQDATHIRTIELTIIWVGIAVMSASLISELLLDVIIRNARADLIANGDEGFDEHVNRLIDKRERRNEIKRRMMNR